MAFDDAGCVLLARHSYGPPVWALLGGGIGKNEDPADAARREFREELRCDLTDLQLVASVTESDCGSQDERYVFRARLAGRPTPDMREIVEIGWFDPGKLPANASKWAGPAVRQALQQR